MKRVIYCFLFFFSFYFCHVYASTCPVQTGSYTVGTNITVQRDAPVGSIIGTWNYGSNSLAYTCTNSGYEGSSAGVKSGILSYAFTASDGSRVFQTRIPGVGIAIGVKTNFQNPKYGQNVTWDYSIGNSNGSNAISQSTYIMEWTTSNPGDVNYWYLQPKIQYYKTGAITSGTLSGQIASFIANGASNGAGAWQSEIPIMGAGSVTQVACSINTPNLTFPIGNIPTSSFGTAVGTIPSGAQNTQNLGLNCDAGANINVSLQGTQNPDVSTTSVLALTGQGSADVASGVGVQLVYNGTPLVLNNRIVLKQSAGGQETFPITARYYQTKTAVTGGKANASATLDLTYQ